MEDSSSEFLQKFIAFFKENLLVISLGVIGIALLLIGLIQLSSGNTEEIVFEPAEAGGEVKNSGSEKQKILVDVSGAVMNPSLYTLNASARVQDALTAAGGLSPEADQSYISKQINLAQKLTDGAKLYVPKVGEQVVLDVASGGDAGLININTASASELDPLPGVGPATSAKIIEGRPYSSVDELLTKKIVSKSVFDTIKEKITTL